MKKVPLIGFGVVLFALVLLTGCNTDDKAKKKTGGDDHTHGSGPNGGTVVDWGGGKYHVEFCMDHKKKQATVHVLDSNGKKAVPVKADKLLLSIKEPSFQIELTAMPQEGEAKGTSSRFVGSHDNFAKEQEFAGTISGEVDGKAFAGDFKEEPETPKKK